MAAYAGIRTVGAHEERKYLEYKTGERELYYWAPTPRSQQQVSRYHALCGLVRGCMRLRPVLQIVAGQPRTGSSSPEATVRL